ncbi:hypothetical protein CEP54_000092 [Fusarium duplospermum]|uniref:Uncharacterized protein n=1 Tax=Fusarium duplospermum TaxID=1325734 RepID=A0A428R859_9HYPO|nr:hypothetical protein CEP54_000092 [Fusarium duplospermum]
MARKKRSASEVKSEPERPPPALRPGPNIGNQRKFLITRKDAMKRAGGVETKINDMSFDQVALVPSMRRWLNRPVIKVLSERMKKKVFDWCQQYDPSWLSLLFEAKGHDLTSYEYTAEEEDPILPEPQFQALRELLMELPPDRDAYKSLWNFARLVTTHSQRVYLVEEVRDYRKDLEYIPGKDGSTELVSASATASTRPSPNILADIAPSTSSTTLRDGPGAAPIYTQYLTDKDGKPPKTAHGFIASDILKADGHRIISSTFTVTKGATRIKDTFPPHLPA